jgi:hypothetical protein
MGAPTANVQPSQPTGTGSLTPVSNNGGKAGGSGKSGMSSIQPSSQTLTADTAQPAMGAPAAYSNTITPDQTAPGLNQSTPSTQMGSGKNGIAGANTNQPQTFGKGQ